MGANIVSSFVPRIWRATNPDLAGDAYLEPGARRYVLGVHLTSGAAALLATTRRLLLRLASQPRASPADVVLILEDDVHLAPGVSPDAISQLLQALKAHELDACHLTRRGVTSVVDEKHAAARCRWDMLLLGYHGGHRGRPADLSRRGGFEVNLTADQLEVQRVTGYAYGAFAYVVRLASVRRLLAAIFPSDKQLDSAYLDANANGRIRMMALRNPLLASRRSLPNDTDIQRLPPWMLAPRRSLRGRVVERRLSAIDGI